MVVTTDESESELVGGTETGLTEVQAFSNIRMLVSEDIQDFLFVIQ